MMKRNIINWYEIRNLGDLSFNYRLLKVDMDVYDSEPALNDKNWNQLLMLVARSVRGPVSTYYHKGEKYIAIEENTKFQCETFKVVPSVAKVSTTNITGKVNFKKLNSSNKRLAHDFLETSIRHQLSGIEDLWKFNNNTFLEKNPLFQTKPSDTDIFAGFSYKLYFDNKNRVYIVIDLAYKYVDTKFISQRISKPGHAEKVDSYKGKRALYQNGNDWYITEVKGIGKPISEQQFIDDSNHKHVVLDYIKEQENKRYGKVISVLDPNCNALLYSYPFQNKIFSGASCLVKLIHNAKDAGQAGLHNKTIKAPTERFYFLSQYLKKYFFNIYFNKIRLIVSTNPLLTALPKLQLPELLFRSGVVLNPSDLHNSNSSGLGDYPKLRKRLLYENGIIQSRPFQKQYIFYPKSLTIHFAKSFREYLVESLKDLAPQFDSFQLVPFNDTDKNCAYSIYKNISKAIDDDYIEDGGAILILPDHIIERGSVLKNVHDCVKKEYYPKLRFQCVSAAKLQSFLYSAVDSDNNIIYNVDYKKQRIFSSYINNLLYKFLILNSKWPYALSQGLNYDIYVGIDAHDYYAGFCFLYKKGEHIVFDYENVPRQTGTYRNEKIGAATIRKVLLRNLERHIPLHAKNPNGIVILRDGRSFGEEEKALENVIEQLAAKGILDSSTIKKGVIDVSKQSLFPIRTARTTNGYSKYSNVAAGKYKALNSKEAFLFNTGYPFHIAGSSNPLHILQRYGDTDFKKVLEDIFHQSMLAFSAPDKSSSLPVTLKIVDTLIRSFAHQTSLVDLEQDDKEAFENYKYN